MIEASLVYLDEERNTGFAVLYYCSNGRGWMPH